MKQRMLGKNGPMISEIGLGTWAMGGPWVFGWGAQEDAESIRTIRRALDLGVTWIDTAAVYGLGHAEEVVAEAIKEHRREVLVATKCGLVWDRRGRVTHNNRPESIRRECEQSLRRLQTEVIDLYQIHWPDPDVPVEDSWGELTRLQEEGKVRYVGVSNFDVPLLARCQQIAPVQSLQPPYSMLYRKIEAEILPWCRENGVGVIAYSPLQSGLLTGKFSRDFLQTLPPDDWRRRHQHGFFGEPKFSSALDFVERIRPLAAAYGKTLTELALAWVLQQPGITAAIVGARRPAQIELNTGGAGWEISGQDRLKIAEIYREIFGE